MKELLKKASKYTFGNANGDCFLMTMCLTKYMLEEKGIMLKSHIGGIKRGNEYVTHLWNSYEGKKIDLTSHRQPKLVANGAILDEPIEVLENAKVVGIKKMDNKLVRDSAKCWIQDVRAIDKNDISVSHILLDNIKTGLVPYETLKKALDHKVMKDPSLYQNFFDYMNMREDTVYDSNKDMINIFESYALPFDFTSEALHIEVSAYNKTIFKSGHMMINSYGLIFKDYIKFCNMNQKRYRMEEFFKDSVENNSSLCDICKELDFKIVGNKILSTYNDTWEESISFGEFHVDNYKVNVSGSSLYFEDLISGKKFMYNGD